jgi:hypothetical protein
VRMGRCAVEGCRKFCKNQCPKYTSVQGDYKWDSSEFVPAARRWRAPGVRGR